MGGARNDLRAAQSFASASALRPLLNEAALAAWSEQTSEERHLALQISESERRQLWRVFDLLCGPGRQRSFGAEELRATLALLGGRPCPAQRLELMVWEVDEDLDRRVDAGEFELMYKRCVEDREGAEPKALFHLVQFLMFCPEREEGPPGAFRPTLLPEDTYALIYARLDRQLGDDSKRARLDEEVELIFAEGGARVGQGSEVDFETYCRRMTALDLRARTEHKEAQKKKVKDLARLKRTAEE